MDIAIRRNEHCVVGLPRCDFVFSSTRSCFIAYGFDVSPLEMSLLRKLLQERQIEAIEAGGSIAPGQNAFCTKICSKIITSQFCIVLLNNTEHGDHEIPSANVNIEYGLMLGFNKYVVPFQRANQILPFNVAGLDTIKYTDRNFERLAAQAIDQAIQVTQQSQGDTTEPDQNLGVFVLSKRALYAAVSDQGEKNLFELGRNLGFNLLHDFGGNNYFYLGNFTMHRPDAVLWRVGLLEEILAGRLSAMPQRLSAGLGTPEQVNFASRLLASMRFWILVTSPRDKAELESGLKNLQLHHQVEVFTLDDVRAALAALPGA